MGASACVWVCMVTHAQVSKCKGMGGQVHLNVYWDKYGCINMSQYDFKLRARIRGSPIYFKSTTGFSYKGRTKRLEFPSKRG